jgi:hypothetical protein
LKKLAAILLLSIFLIQTTGQHWILFSFFLNRSYIAENICINRFDRIPVCKGSCYLEKQINTSNKQQEKQPDLKLKELNLFCEDDFNQVAMAAINASGAYSLFPEEHLPNGNSKAFFHPPALS